MHRLGSNTGFGQTKWHMECNSRASGFSIYEQLPFGPARAFQLSSLSHPHSSILLDSHSPFLPSFICASQMRFLLHLSNWSCPNSRHNVCPSPHSFSFSRHRLICLNLADQMESLDLKPTPWFLSGRGGVRDLDI